MRGYIVVAGALVLILAAGWLVSTQLSQPSSEGVVCTMEAKLCPDGSYVGRSGPNCEFAACPTPSATSTSFDARLGIESSGLGVQITPLEVLEDSRCPTDVVCIQAGTVRVKASVVVNDEDSTQTFTLGKTLVVGTKSITLSSVTPTKLAGVAIAKSNYVFHFDITN